MTESSTLDIAFVWWNTGLSPPVPNRTATKVDVDFVVAQISRMRASLEFTVLGLAEVNSKDLDAIRDGLADSMLQVVDRTDRDGRMKFDTALIFDSRRLELIQTRSFVEYYGKSRMKLGELISFITVHTKTPLHVVISHWPSRLTSFELSARRAELGTLLRKSLEDIRNGNTSPYIVLMGDYNDDPFSPSLAEHLLATRDRQLAIRDARFFYNPFWRCLGESLPNSQSPGGVSVCGSHFYPNGEHTEWFTYDQIIFSSAFLSDGPITLSEEHTRIITTPELINGLQDPRAVCDHFPVLSLATLRSRP